MSSEYPEGSGHGGVAACAWAWANVVKASGDRVEKARCQSLRIGLSTSGDDPSCINWWLMIKE
jgi:hypothetical protein